MKPDDPIRLTGLLLEREAELARVAECERLIRGILGQPYSFPPPPQLPSLARGRKKPPARTVLPAAGAGAASLPPNSSPIRAAVDQYRARFQAGAVAEDGIRTLRAPENAYRVTYRRGGETAVSLQTDRRLLQRLLALDEPEFAITEIAAGTLHADDRFAPTEVL